MVKKETLIKKGFKIVTDDNVTRLYDPDGNILCGALYAGSDEEKYCTKLPYEGSRRCRYHGGAIINANKIS